MILKLYKRGEFQGGPVAKCLKFPVLCFGSPGSWVQILGADLLHSSAMLWRHPIYKVEAIGTDVSSGVIFLKQKKRIGNGY